MENMEWWLLEAFKQIGLNVYAPSGVTVIPLHLAAALSPLINRKIAEARRDSLQAVGVFAHSPSATWETLYEYLEKQIGVVQSE